MARTPNVKKSLSISHKLNDDLNQLTEVLGVNAHSYIVNALAMCVARDIRALHHGVDVEHTVTDTLEMLRYTGDID